MSDKAPRGERFIISLAGRTNAGKSSLINALTGQDVAIVSEHPGTTTDPVAKPYELLPLGPVTLYDTAGLGDTGELGEKRMRATRKILLRSDVVLLVMGEHGAGEAERELAESMHARSIPFVAAFNKCDLGPPEKADLDFFLGLNAPCLSVSAATGHNTHELRQMLAQAAPPEMLQTPVLAGDLFNESAWVLCVVPIDLAAPKGRLILPQVQVLREILDCDAVAVTVKERELPEALAGLSRNPALVITDSQVILNVAGDVPDDIPLTTFSTLFARYKGDLDKLSQGANAIDSLRDGDTVLMAEACSHHPVADDIGRVKIPRWISQYTGADLSFETCVGNDFPDDLSRFALVVHCGACMLTRKEMLRRINECERTGVPITNYGVAISKVQGVLDRVLRPFSHRIN